MDTAEYLIAAIGLLFLYPFFVRQLIRYVEPTRQRLFELADELENDPRVHEDDRRMLAKVRRDALSPWPMVWAMVIVPKFVTFDVFRLGDDGPKTTDPVLQAKLSKAAGLAIQSIAAANPVCTVIVGLELLIIFVVVVLVGAPRHLFRRLIHRLFANRGPRLRRRHA